MSRLQRLTIENIRGIRSLQLDLRGRNCVIFGPNGCGKSSVADAIDFLLTGDIRRLAGEGTMGMSVARHGRHVDVEPRDAWVKGVFDGSKGECTLKRSVAKPEELKIEGELPADVALLLVAATLGSHHMLTRREVLRYIFTQPKDRLEQVSALLRLTRTDMVRKELHGAASDADYEWKRATAITRAQQDAVLLSVAPRARSSEEVLARANLHRATLGAPALPKLVLEVRAGVTPPLEAPAHPLQAPAVKAQVEDLRRWVSEWSGNAAGYVREYVAEARAIQEDADSLKALRAASLIEQGLELATEHECPLCRREWENEELVELLRDRLRASAEARDKNRALERKWTELTRRIASRMGGIRSLAEAIRGALPEASGKLDGYVAGVEVATETLLVDPLRRALPDDTEGMLAAYGNRRGEEAVREIDAAASGLPDLGGVQQAWDELTAIQRTFGAYIAVRKEEQVALKVKRELAIAAEEFVKSRDAVLAATYAGISGELADLYRALHGEDEGTFTAELSPTSAGLRLEVDFYGRGPHPPSALHSEGHQDSMGVCLFLALSEHLSEGATPLIILDDVLMSVDQGHRQRLADMLRERFPDVQFVITTHDEVWFRQLKTLGVAKAEQCVEITDWSIESGPQRAGEAPEVLLKAETALAKNDVRGASHLLRMSVEMHFRDYCDLLGAKVRYRADRLNGAGEFQGAALSRLKDIIAMAKKAAGSWGQEVGAIDEFEKKRADAARLVNEHGWLLNPTVHYNEWATGTVQDFAPVLDAYKRLFEVFVCGKCESAYRVLYEDGVKERALRCACGAVNWNLEKKPGG